MKQTKIKTPNSNFAKYGLENNRNINFGINKDLDIFNIQNKIYIKFCRYWKSYTMK